MVDIVNVLWSARKRPFTAFSSAILFASLLFGGIIQCDAQTPDESTPAQLNKEVDQQDFDRNELADYPVPSEKDVHPNQWYDGWVKELARTEKLLADDTISRSVKAMEHWNRFLSYFKLVPDDSSEIMAIFMEAYRFDRHHFCKEYSEWIPRLTKGNYAYCLELYKNEKPAMDEIVRLVMASYDQELVRRLAKVQDLDQNLRGSISKETDAEEKSRILEQQRKLDLANLEVIEKIIDEHGYPGRSLVGIEYEMVAFLVIQHSGGETIGKYLPLIKTAISNQELQPKVYPYLFDRFEVSNGRPQHFGTQRKLDTNELFPLIDAKNVNERRKQYGLPPIQVENK